MNSTRFLLQFAAITIGWLGFLAVSIGWLLQQRKAQAWPQKGGHWQGSFLLWGILILVYLGLSVVAYVGVNMLDK